jgi:transcriptional regulator with GAF, ATPase, and Fis domain
MNVEEFREVLLDVWREACRHIEIGESTGNMAAILQRHMPLEQVFVRHIDPQRSCLETLALRAAGPDGPELDVRSECSAPAMKRLLEWCRRGEIARRDAEVSLPSELRCVVPSGIEGSLLVGPMGDARRPVGVLLLAAPPGRSFTARHVALTRVLLEPFSVALENDRRLRETEALREAAEADKRSLLTRLGRRQLADTIVGVEAGLGAVMERVELVARSDAPVLIFGETGTGKELIARAIHGRSNRSAGPFHRVNCGAIPPELIDSQLFGHEQGAFTGAVEMRRGWFERADGGTLFLDEIGELPLAAQVRLLRILQDGQLERVGGQKAIHLDVRIVAATHCDLAGMVTEGRFREDLWYRIAVFPVFLPPLRERRDDIPALAQHLAERAATRFGLPLVSPSAEDVELLASYAWPGNVRELAAVIDRAAILGNGKRLEVTTALGITTDRPTSMPDPGPRRLEPAQTSREILPLDAAMRRHIEKALAATDGRIEGPHGAARLLEINPHTLRARMRKLGIDWQRFRPTGPPTENG